MADFYELLGVHRNASLLAVVFLVVHIATAIIDPYAPIDVVDAFVPFGSAYKPLWLGLGALALDLLIAVIVTSLVRVRMGHRAWRAIHWLAYAIWPIALLHGYRTGTDLRSGALLFVTMTSVAVVAFAIGWRIVSTLRAVPHPARTHVVLDEQRAVHRDKHRNEHRTGTR